MSIPDDLTSLVPDDYTERPSAGLVPNPLALIDAARLIAAVFGWSPSETFAGIFGAIWRGEIKRVFTWEAPRIQFRSEPDQEIEDILASPPLGAWVDGNAVASDDMANGRERYVRPRPVFWSRAEMLAVLGGMGYLPIDPALIDPAHPEIAYELLARQPLSAWGERSRMLIWDRLLTSKRRLARWWMATREVPMPAFLAGMESAEPAAAIQEAAPGTVGIVGSSGGRRRDAADDARRKNNIEIVLAAAKQLWPDNQQRPSTTTMARELVRKKKAQGYASDTLRQILDGRYRPAKRLGIDLGW